MERFETDEIGLLLLNLRLSALPLRILTDSKMLFHFALQCISSGVIFLA